MRLFSTEQISKYHPDKYADQIADAILTECLKKDPKSRVACEVLVKNNTVVLAGEITSKAGFEVIESAVYKIAQKLDYKVDEIIDLLTEQSPEINEAVGENGDPELGAGDQGMVFGYAVKGTESKLPYGFHIANKIIKAIERDVVDPLGGIKMLKGDAKVQVTVDLDITKEIDRPIHTVLISACHEAKYSIEEVRSRIASLLWFNDIPYPTNKLIINPNGAWTIGGPTADAGLTGRKIVCDQYGGYAPVGGGAFSGKDPTKVDRSAAYAARLYALELLEKHDEAKEVTVQIAYAIGQALPVSLVVELKGDRDLTELSEQISQRTELAKFTPQHIIDRLKLLEAEFDKIAEGCHYYGTHW